jgi:oligopeptide transport system permease protein
VRKYIWGRILRSIISIFLVTTIAMIMIYTQIPREKIFKNDSTYTKLGGDADAKTEYKYTKWEKLGYLDFVEQKDMCAVYTGTEYNACMEADSDAVKTIVQDYVNKGYTSAVYTKNGLAYVFKDKPVLNIVWNFYHNMFQLDNPGRVSDPDNPNLERKVYAGKDYAGNFAIMCSGCDHKYLLYFDGSFPWIHQNFIMFSLGTSYPTYDGQLITDVIGTGQGTDVMTQKTFETGQTSKSALLLHSCTYKQTSTLDRLDKNKFNDNYAYCSSQKSDPSMISQSMLFGTLALLIAYVLSIPAGMSMASHKGQLRDKIGTVYINFMIAVPSLAFIFLARVLFSSLFALPDKFSILGAHDVRSYVLPIITLALLDTSSIMLWTRRYMIDQSSADYVKFARAKGLSQREIFTHHIMRNAIIPIAQSLPSNIILTICGAVITETVFAIPGTGKLLPDAIKAYNNQMIVALTLIFTALSIFSVLLGDLLITWLDPRIQLVDKEGGAV